MSLVSQSLDAAPGAGDVSVPALAEHEARDERLEEPDLTELAVSEQEMGERRAAAITAAAEREPVDPEWGPATRQQIIELFAANGPPGSTLISATCKTTLCITEVQTLSRRESVGPQAWYAYLGLARGFVLPRESEQEGEYRSVVFLARDGHDLPK